MSLVPRKRKDRDKTEDVELLKLVGAVLDSAAGQTSRRLTLSQRLRRARISLERKVQKHPIVMFGILCCFLVLAFVIGVTSASTKLKQGIAASAGSERPGPSGSHGSPGTRGTRGKRGTASSAAGNTVGAGGAGRLVDSDLGRRDLAKDLIDRVVDGGYAQRSDIATGRFLRDFENQWLLLVDVDRSQLQPARRAKTWMQVRGPYHISEAHAKAELTRGSVPFKEMKEAIIRVVEEDEVWKLEHIRVY